MNNLKEIRMLKKLKQQDIADFLGVSRPTYTRYETGERQPDAQTVERLSAFFSVPSSFIRGEGVFSNWEEFKPCRKQIAQTIISLGGSTYTAIENDLRTFIVVLNALVEKIETNGHTFQVFFYYDGILEDPIDTTKKSALNNEGGHSAVEEKLILLFRQIPVDRQSLVLDMIETALKSQGLL